MPERVRTIPNLASRRIETYRRSSGERIELSYLHFEERMLAKQTHEIDARGVQLTW